MDMFCALLLQPNNRVRELSKSLIRLRHTLLIPDWKLLCCSSENTEMETEQWCNDGAAALTGRLSALSAWIKEVSPDCKSRDPQLRRNGSVTLCARRRSAAGDCK